MRVFDGEVKHEVIRAQEEKKMYFKVFLLNPIKLDVTFNMNPGALNASNGPLRILVQIVGTTFAK
jgi:hypothetical protein